jgi:hypothetical protein
MTAQLGRVRPQDSQGPAIRQSHADIQKYAAGAVAVPQAVVINNYSYGWQAHTVARLLLFDHAVCV